MIKRILISGGGTGGHIFPALSIANAVKRRYPDAEILFVGAEDRMEMQRVPAAGYKIIGLPVAGFDRRHLLRNGKVMVKLLKSMMKAKKILKDFNPQIAVGVGGYASGPMLKAAQKAGIPTVVQEQNSYAGVTNKLLAKKVSAVCTAYPGMERFFPEEKIVITGNPVRKDLLANPCTQTEAKEKLGFDPGRPLILAVGGSLGARTINDSILAALDKIEASGVQLLWQTGSYNADTCAEKASGYDSIKATRFISDMGTAYRAADLVVSRAGAGTISELQLLGKAAILVPSPNVAEDHQRKNAEALSTRGAAVLILDADAQDTLADTALKLVADVRQCESLSAKIKEMALKDSDEKIVDIIDNILKDREA